MKNEPLPPAPRLTYLSHHPVQHTNVSGGNVFEVGNVSSSNCFPIDADSKYFIYCEVAHLNPD